MQIFTFTGQCIYNLWWIKAAPQRPSHDKVPHDKVPQKHAANWQGNTSQRSMIPTKLLLCIFIEISLRHGWPHSLQIRRICSKKLLKSNTSKGLLAMHLHTTLIVNIRKLYLTWHNPEAVFKNTLVYWHK